jgi:hypothetical protein
MAAKHDIQECICVRCELLRKDHARMAFLERWVQSARDRGFVWDTFTFDTHKSVRDQIDEQMKAGMVELPKRTADNHEYGDMVRAVIDPAKAFPGAKPPPCSPASGGADGA